jgi:hypothetical protein
MSLISGFVHCNIFRIMCDPNDDKQTLNNSKMETPSDIEMGLKEKEKEKDNNNIIVVDANTITNTITKTNDNIFKFKCPMKKGNNPDYWWV